MCVCELLIASAEKAVSLMFSNNKGWSVMGLRQGLNRVFVLALSFCISVMAGCNSGRSYTKVGMQETLEVQILPNTSKMFVYRLRMPEDQIPSQVRIAQSSRDSVQQTGVDLGAHSYRSLLMNVEYVVKKSGYCREGFLEIDKSLSRYHIWMKGECKEGSTTEDLQKFGKEMVLNSETWR